MPLSKDRSWSAPPSYDLKEGPHQAYDGSLGDIRQETYTYYNVGQDWQ